MTDAATADWEALRREATRARDNAHAPYSGFRVGAALLDADGRTFTGANVENASYGLTLCAERSAVACAAVAGARRFGALAIVAPGTEPVPPCGMCRQVLAEFPPSFPIRSYAYDGRYREWTVDELLPEPFRL